MVPVPAAVPNPMATDQYLIPIITAITQTLLFSYYEDTFFSFNNIYLFIF